MTIENHVQFVQVLQQDAEFNKFVDNVSPRVQGIQQVWIAELFMVLKLLWEVFQILKGLGFFKGWFETRKVKKAMRGQTTEQKELMLLEVRNGLLSSVRR